MSKFTEIYKLTNVVNGKAYVGIATFNQKRPNRRWNQHVHDMKRGVDNPLYRAMRKYGTEKFQRDTLFYTFTWEEACEAEQAMIAHLKTFIRNGVGYNSTLGGEGNVGRIISRATRQRMRAAKLGSMGHRWSQEQRAKYANSVRGQIRPSVKGGNHPMACPVMVNGVQYPSSVEAREALGLTRRQIQRRLDSNKYPEYQRVA